MTNSEHAFESKTNVCISGLYSLLSKKNRQEVPVPDTDEINNFGWPTNYYMFGEYLFMTTEGEDSILLQQYQLYMKSDLPQLENTLVYDVTGDKWYAYRGDSVTEVGDIYSIGDWQLLW